MSSALTVSKKSDSDEAHRRVRSKLLKTLDSDIEKFLASGGEINRMPILVRSASVKPLKRTRKKSTGVKIKKGMLTIEQVAERLGYSVGQVRVAVREKKLTDYHLMVEIDGALIRCWNENDIKCFVGTPFEQLERLYVMDEFLNMLRASQTRVYRRVNAGDIAKPSKIRREAKSDHRRAIKAWTESELQSALQLNWGC